MPVTLPFTQMVLPLIILFIYVDIVVLLEIHLHNYHSLMKFSTKDNENVLRSNNNCALFILLVHGGIITAITLT